MGTSVRSRKKADEGDSSGVDGRRRAPIREHGQTMDGTTTPVSMGTEGQRGNEI